MKNLLNYLLIATIAIAVSSCGMFHNVSMVPSTALGSDNYVYVRDVYAQIHYTYVFGFGGLTYKNITEELMQNAHLQPGEALADVGIQYRIKCFLGVVIIKEFVATGKVVRFIDSAEKPEQTSSQEQTSSPEQTSPYVPEPINSSRIDLSDVFPVSSVNVKFGSDLNQTLLSNLTTEQISDAIKSSLITKKNSAFDAEASNVMDIIVKSCDKDAIVSCYAEFKDENGNIISSVKVEGEGYGFTKRENLVISAFKNVGEKLYRKWRNK